MTVTMLMENTAASPDFACAHGVSMLIEAGGKKVLFDAGPNADFAANAKKLGIDLGEVDFAVLSHAHSDHGGGLPAFLAQNHTAPLYLSRHAFGDYVAMEPPPPGQPPFIEDAGIDKAMEGHPQVRPVEGVTDLGDGFTLFSLPEDAPRPASKAASVLYERAADGTLLPDRFLHEQNLLVREGEKTALFSGCAHCGILGILKRAEELAGGEVDVVMGGFHLHNPDTAEAEDEAWLNTVAAELAARKKTRYYAFHCTGAGPYKVLEKALGGRLGWPGAGTRLVLW